MLERKGVLARILRLVLARVLALVLVLVMPLVLDLVPACTVFVAANVVALL